MNPDELPESRAARRFRQFFEDRGKAEGVVEGKRDALLTLLDARSLAASDDDRAMIGACTDTALLNQWIVRAATARGVAEVLNQPARALTVPPAGN